MPSLNKKTYNFNNSPNICWGHPLRPPRHKNYINVVVSRDPRDALYSWWRRDHSKGSTFLEFLKKPNNRFFYHVPFLKERIGKNDLVFKNYWNNELKRIEKNNFGNVLDDHMATYEVMFSSLNREDPKKNLYIFRFEDIKSAPVINVLNLLNLINVERGIDEINAAIAASS